MITQTTFSPVENPTLSNVSVELTSYTLSTIPFPLLMAKEMARVFRLILIESENIFNLVHNMIK